MQRFDGIPEPARQDGAVVALPPQVLAELGQGRRFRARGTFDGTDPTLRRAFDALAPSHRREHAASVADAKKPETKARRVQKIVDDLRTDR